MSAQFTPGQEASFTAFGRAVREGLEGEDLRYPDRAEFIGLDLDRAGQMAWEALREGRSVILVDPDGAEFWFLVAQGSIHQRLINCLFRRVAVMIYSRPKPAPAVGSPVPLVYAHIRSRSLLENIPQQHVAEAMPA